jgi:PleD family two-component response regulator
LLYLISTTTAVNCVPRTGLSRAKIDAQRIRKRVMAIRLSAHQVQFGVTVSIGMPRPASACPASMRCAAESALYVAKADGRNKCVCWSPPSPPRKAAE